MPWTDLSAAGLLSLTVLLIVFGYLIPRWTHTQRIADKDKQIALFEKMLEKRDEQVGRLIEQNEVIVKLLEDIKSASGRHVSS